MAKATETIQEAADVRPIPAVAPSESARPMQVMSSQDSIIADLIKESPSLDEISRMTVSSNRIVDPLALPEECLVRQKKEFRYKWLNKDKELPTKLRVQGWVLCNKTTSPYIRPSRFSSHGGLEQAGMLLAFMPEAMARELEVIPAQRSAELVKRALSKGTSTPKDAPIGFYEPKLSGEDDD